MHKFGRRHSGTLSPTLPQWATGLPPIEHTRLPAANSHALLDGQRAPDHPNRPLDDPIEIEAGRRNRLLPAEGE